MSKSTRLRFPGKADRIRRSWMLGFILDDAQFEAAIGSTADVITPDLEDTVPDEQKEIARKRLEELFESGRGRLGDHEIFVRVNNLYTPWGYADIEAVARLDIDGVMYPMARSAEEVWQVRRMLEAAGSNAEIEVLLETPESYLNIQRIAQVRGVSTLTHSRGDLYAELDVVKDDRRDRLAATAAMTVIAAKAYGLFARDGLHTSKWDDPDAVREFLLEARREGFDGMGSIHLSHMDIINDVWSPSAEEVEHSRKVVDVFENGSGESDLVVDGQPVMRPDYMKALHILRTTE